MFLFLVQYMENERNTFSVWRLQDETQWRSFLTAKLPDHLCGYLVNEVRDVREIPFLQRQKFYRGVTGGELERKEPGEVQFFDILNPSALDFTEDRLASLSRDKRRRSMNTTAAPGTQPAAPAAPAAPAGAAPAAPADGAAAPAAAPKTRSRFTVDPNKKIKLLVTENPRRKGSQTYEIFKAYRQDMTVEEALKTGKIRMIDIKADIERKHIELV